MLPSPVSLPFETQPAKSPATQPPTSITPAHPVSRSHGAAWERRGAAPPLPPAHRLSHPPLSVLFSFLPLKISCDGEARLLGNAGAALLGLVPWLFGGAQSDALLRQQTPSWPKCSCEVTQRHPHSSRRSLFCSSPPRDCSSCTCCRLGADSTPPNKASNETLSTQAPAEPEPLLHAMACHHQDMLTVLGQRPLAFTSSVAGHQAGDKHSWLGATQGLSSHHGIWECWPDPTPFPASFILNEEPCTSSKSSVSCLDRRSPLLYLFIAGLRKSASKPNWRGERRDLPQPRVGQRGN